MSSTGCRLRLSPPFHTLPPTPPCIALQATAPGSIISFVTNDADLSRVVVEQTELFKITVSFGNVCSLIRWGLDSFTVNRFCTAVRRPPASVPPAVGLPLQLLRFKIRMLSCRRPLCPSTFPRVQHAVLHEPRLHPS